MWRDYFLGFIKNNRGSALSVATAVFISTLFLSLLCSLFFNFWNYEIERIVLEEGSWQARITGSFSEDTIADIKDFKNVKKAEFNNDLSSGQDVVIDIYFHDMKTVYKDMVTIAEALQIPDSDVSYHEILLSEYLIHNPNDTKPPLLMMFYLVILAVVSLSLILIIHNSFALAMNARVRQFGTLSSIGASPGQIRSYLLQEAAITCTIPILLGSAGGILLSFGTVQLINMLAANIAGRHEAVFVYHPLVLAITLFSSFVTVFVSALIPARRLSKLTALTAVKGGGELQLKKRRDSRILSALFGIEGELAGAALKSQKKAFRTSTLSLTLSFMGFTIMLCFFTLSGISTDHTYFERYQDAWDVMATLEDTPIETFETAEKVSRLNGIKSSVIYQKAAASNIVPETVISDELREIGGLTTVAGESVDFSNGSYSIPAVIVIMDNMSFEEYCRQIGITPDVSGSIVLNRIWDSVNSNFRYKEFIPYFTGEERTIKLRGEETGNTVDLPILGFSDEPPLLREEYDNYSIVQFISLSLWQQIKDSVGGAEDDTYIRIIADEGAALSELNVIEEELLSAIGGEYSFEIENRIQERIDNDKTLKGYMLIIGALCSLLAIIGLANVFSNTLGFVRHRKREFARYISVGMTESGIRKMFLIEALVIGGRPVLLTLPLTVVIVGFMIAASYLNPAEFLAEAPILPIFVFILAVFIFVAIAYYIGGKRIMQCSLVELLKNDGIF